MYALIQLPVIITVECFPLMVFHQGENFFEIFIPRGGLWSKNAYVKV